MRFLLRFGTLPFKIGLKVFTAFLVVRAILKAMAANLRDLTLYLVVLIIVSTLGPLQFGFHLVCLPFPSPRYLH